MHLIPLLQSFLNPVWGNGALSFICFYIRLNASLYALTSDSKSTVWRYSISFGLVFFFSLGRLAVPVKSFLSLRSLIFRAIFSPVNVFSPFSYFLGGASFTQSGSGYAHLAICGSSIPGEFICVGHSLNPALGVPCFMSAMVIWLYLLRGFAWHFLPRPLSDWPFNEKCPHWNKIEHLYTRLLYVRYAICCVPTIWGLYMPV